MSNKGGQQYTIDVTFEETAQAFYKCVFMGVGVDLAFTELTSIELLARRKKLYKPCIIKLHKNGKSIAELSREFGINRHTITGWIRNN